MSQWIISINIIFQACLDLENYGLGEAYFIVWSSQRICSSKCEIFAVFSSSVLIANQNEMMGDVLGLSTLFFF